MYNYVKTREIGYKQLSEQLTGQYEADFGSTAVSSATFTVTNGVVKQGCTILANVAYEATSDNSADACIIEPLEITCGSGNGSFPMYIQTVDGSYVRGKFKINYLIMP